VSGDTAPLFARVTPPLLDSHFAVKLVIFLPFVAPALNVTLSEPAATLTALMWVGAPGDPTITAADGTDQAPAPRELIARTVHVYRFPVVRCVTVNGDALPVFERSTPPLLDVHAAL